MGILIVKSLLLLFVILCSITLNGQIEIFQNITNAEQSHPLVDDIIKTTE